MRQFTSTDGGVSWSPPIQVLAGFHDKEWMAIDGSGGIGQDNLYIAYTGAEQFLRSTDGGLTWDDPIECPVFDTFWGTMTVGPDGALYLIDAFFLLVRSTNAQDPTAQPTFDTLGTVDFGGVYRSHTGPNPGGLLAQPWIASDASGGPYHGNLYALCSVNPSGADPLDVMFTRSTDSGQTWSAPLRVNDDVQGSGRWQWFGTLSVAPDGRIDACWYDTRNAATEEESQLFYACSSDGGQTWSENLEVTPLFSSTIGYAAGEQKIGDYIGLASTITAANIAYAETFNGEQDVWFVSIPADCNGNGLPDGDDIDQGISEDCTGNRVPDECEPDCNANGTADSCDLQSGFSTDCNGDLKPDDCQPDLDSDGIIDVCDDDIDGDGVLNDDDDCGFTTPGLPVNELGRSIGDTDGDCDVDLIDYDRFVPCRSAGGPGTPAPSDGCRDLFDGDADADVDLADFAIHQRAFTGS